METYIPSDAYAVAATPDAAYSAQLELLAPNIGSIIEEQRAPNESWVDSLARLLPVLASTYQQRQLLQVQVERARNGLPPLDASQYAAGVNVGLSPQTQRLLIWGGVGVLALVWIMSQRKRAT